MNISIIGAGPAGSYAAKLLAEQGHDVSIYEDHPCVGVPVQCTGLVTKTFLELSQIKKEFLVNEMKKVRVVAPNDTTVEIPLTEYVLDRAKLDQYLANQAINSGAKIFLQHRFVSIKNGNIIIKHNGEWFERKTDILIGADGPLSEVAKSAGVYGQRKMFIGHQATLQGNFEPEIFTTHFGKLARDFFAWIVPESNTIARVGLQSFSNVKPQFDAFIKYVGGKVLEIQAGPIPFYTGKEIVETSNTFLVGDAAGLAKATTGGGIYTGMMSSKILADCIETGQNYTKALRPLKRMLWMHKIIHRTLNNFSDENYNQLIKLMNKESIKEILNTHTREQPAKILPRVLLKEPRLLRFVTKMF